MKPSITPEKWAAIRAICEGETPSLELAAFVSGIDATVLDERRRKFAERQGTEGARA